MKTELKNTYEDLIEQLILLKENKVSSATYIKQVVKMLREYVQVAETNIKTMGEVMTPIELVEEMLDTLPKDVWSNPNLKWLDPCAGVGVFECVVVERLMKGLKTFQPDEELRYKHIMENMIYICELQSKNVFLYMCAFDLTSTLNIYNGSFLDEGFDKHTKEVWGIDKFDVIVMNPPYQKLKEGNKKSQPLWHLFVEKTLNMLVENGYLVAVHPSGWRNVDGAFKNTQNLLKERQMQYLNINNYKKGFETFGAKTDFDYYCVRNILNTKSLTKIVDIDEKVVRIDISNLPFIPKCNIQEVLSLVAKDGEEKVNALYSRSAYGNDKPHMRKEGEEKVSVLHSFSSYETRKDYVSKEKNDEFKYPCVYTVGSPDKGNKPTFLYSKIRKEHFGIKKVIFANGATGVFVDETGEFGLTQFATGIIDDVENLECIKKALLNEYFIKNIMGYRNSLGNNIIEKLLLFFRKDFWKEFID